MKTEDEIRRHLRDLTLLKGQPCDCAGTEHEMECAIGGSMMNAVAVVLRWVLGEHESYESTVTRFRRGAAAVRNVGKNQ